VLYQGVGGLDIWKALSKQCRCDKVALRTTCINIIKMNIIKVRADCQYRLLILERNLNRAAQNRRLGPHVARGLELAALDLLNFTLLCKLIC